jgi:glycosyltransferase involved in cell wall biosynthesis
LKITYISTENPEDLHSWSGLTHYIAQCLVKAGHDLSYIHSLRSKPNLIIKLKQKLYPKLTGKFIQANRYASVNNQFAPQIQKILKTSEPKPDFIFSNSTETIAALKTNIPIAIWVDASFAGMIGYYPEFNILHPESIKKANQLEQKAYDQAAVIFFASDWAAQSALKNYQLAPNKVKVVPFGANIIKGIVIDEIEGILKQKSKEVCKLLFIGVNWERKGGPKTIEIAQALIKAGVATELIVVGCLPFTKDNCPSFVKQIGFLSKKNSVEEAQIISLFKEAHFFILPSLAECYGLVYAEANAYALPAIGTKTGGITTIIKDEINGKTFDLDADPTLYVEFIKSYFEDVNAYQQLALSSFNEYENRLNWAVSGQKVSEILSKVLEEN